MASEKTYPMEDYREGFEKLASYESFDRNGSCNCYDDDYYSWSDTLETYCECDNTGTSYGIRVDCAVTKKPKSPKDTTYHVSIYKVENVSYSFNQDDVPDTHFNQSDALFSFVVEKFDTACQETQYCEMAQLVSEQINESNDMPGYFTCNKAGCKTNEYIDTFENLCAAMAKVPEKEPEKTENPHVKSKRKKKKKGRK